MGTTDRYPDAEAVIAEVVDDDGPRRLRARRLPHGPRGVPREPPARRRPRPVDRSPRGRRTSGAGSRTDSWSRTGTRQHPEIDDLPVRGPIDINGLPRTGTTALANMLSLDPQFRSLRGWEQKHPVPPPVLGQEDTDWRRQALTRRTRNLPAELHAMHIYEVDATMEDGETLGLSFQGQQFTLPVYGYHDWWRRGDITDGFTLPTPDREGAAVGAPARPVAVQGAAPQLPPGSRSLSVYPDVQFVMTHRDPAKSVPSWASIVSTIFPPSSSPRPPPRAVTRSPNHLRTGVENAIEARSRIGEDRFLDVYHRELVRRPDGRRPARLRLARPTSSLPTPRRRCVPGRRPTAARSTATTATRPSSSA